MPVYFNQNPLEVSLGDEWDTTIEFPNIVEGEKTFLLIMKEGELKLNSQGPITQKSAVLKASDETKRMFFKTEGNKIICYIEGVSEDVSFVLSQI
jgi:hypothetical protein